MTTTYTTKIWGDTFEISADFARASCPIKGDLHGRQVADFRHSARAAMRSLLEEIAVMGGDDPEDAEDEIEAALDAMVGRDADLIEMAEMLERHGDRFTGNNTDDEAQGWLDEGFDADSADAWCEIGCWDATTAAKWRDAGMTPSQISDAADAMLEAEIAEWDAIDEAAAEEDHDWTPCTRESQYTDGNPIYSACNGDTRRQALIDAAK